jgi:hypothetical protein
MSALGIHFSLQRSSTKRTSVSVALRWTGRISHISSLSRRSSCGESWSITHAVPAVKSGVAGMFIRCWGTLAKAGL